VVPKPVKILKYKLQPKNVTTQVKRLMAGWITERSLALGFAAMQPVVTGVVPLCLKRVSKIHKTPPRNACNPIVISD
jgi:hypothetical protein